MARDGPCRYAAQMDRLPLTERAVRVALFVLPVLVALSAALALWAHSRAGKGGALDLATIDAGVMTLDLGPVDIRATMDAAVEAVLWVQAAFTDGGHDVRA